MIYNVGIDLGTNVSSIAIIDQNGSPKIVKNNLGKDTTPSIVAFNDGEFLVGQAAVSAIPFADEVISSVKLDMEEADD